jgi:exonuclease III
VDDLKTAPHSAPLRLRGGLDPQQIPNLRIGALNIKGANSPTTKNKWPAILRKMEHERFGILCLSETHADLSQQSHLEKSYGSRWNITHSFNPEHPRSGGIAVIINKSIIRKDPTMITNIIPGWALLMEIEWAANFTIKILAIYAPNVASNNNNAHFWSEISQKTGNTPIDIMLGDLNVVEEAIDRFPPPH